MMYKRKCSTPSSVPHKFGQISANRVAIKWGLLYIQSKKIKVNKTNL